VALISLATTKSFPFLAKLQAFHISVLLFIPKVHCKPAKKQPTMNILPAEYCAAFLFPTPN
jgi:hypothetical protein